MVARTELLSPVEVGGWGGWVGRPLDCTVGQYEGRNGAAVGRESRRGGGREAGTQGGREGDKAAPQEAGQRDAAPLFSRIARGMWPQETCGMLCGVPVVLASYGRPHHGSLCCDEEVTVHGHHYQRISSKG